MAWGKKLLGGVSNTFHNLLSLVNFLKIWHFKQIIISEKFSISKNNLIITQLKSYYIVEFCLKSGKHSTKNPEFGPKPGEIQEKPAKKYSRMMGGTQKCTIFWGAKLSFILFWPSFFLLCERLHCHYIYFHCSYMYNYQNYSQTMHFIPRFNQFPLLCKPRSKKG